MEFIRIRAIYFLLWLPACTRDGVISIPSEREEERVLFGDVHVHTGLGSGDACAADAGPEWNRRATCGTMEDLAENSIENGMDFIFLTDHVNGKRDVPEDSNPSIADEDGGDEAWRSVCDWAYENSTPDFLAICGAEVIVTEADGTKHGHKTLAFFGDESELASLSRNELSPNGINENSPDTTESSDVADCPSVKEWLDGLHDEYGELLCIPHHPAATQPMRNNWNCHHGEYEAAVEVWSEQGSSRLRLGTVSPHGDDHDPLLMDSGESRSTNSGTYGYVAATFFEDSSYDMAVLGGSDHHETRGGYVCEGSGDLDSNRYGAAVSGLVVSEDAELTRELIYETIVKRHTFASTGPRVRIKQEVYDDSRYLGTMGDGFDLQKATELTFEITIPEPFAEEVVGAWVVKRGVCTSGADATCTESRFEMSRVTDDPERFRADVSMDADEDENNDDGAYVLLELEGPNAHPLDCLDGGVDDRERIMTSEVHTY